LLRAFAVVLAYAAVCAFLVVVGSQAGTARGQTGRLFTDTRSAMTADYSTGGQLPILTALKPEIVEAAAKDNAALGVEPLLPPRAVSEAPASGAAQRPSPSDGKGDADGEASARPDPPASAPELPAATGGASDGGGLPMPLVLAGLVVATAAVWGAYYLVRPRSD
jgi:hypothetical protein